MKAVNTLFHLTQAAALLWVLLTWAQLMNWTTP